MIELQAETMETQDSGHMVYFNTMLWANLYSNIIHKFCDENGIDDYDIRLGVVVFKKEEDAALCLLRFR